jgi:glucosamine--fructose-6-phosphate aminotransferase (isomerizing)
VALHALSFDWHTGDFPELRSGLPWVMEDMIRAQGTLPGRFTGLDAASVIKDSATRALAAGAEVTVIGCGTSEHAAMAIAALLREGLATSPREARRIRSQQSLDAALEPSSDGLVIGVSHDGGTRATRLALDNARREGAATAVITARPDSDCARAADHIFAIPIQDQSWCHTVAYTSAILAGAAIAYAGSGTAWSAAAGAALGAALSDDTARTAGRGLHPAQRVLTVGMGADLISARELALKIEEGARIPATAHHLETLFHGHFAACEPGLTRVVFFAGDRRLAEPYRRRLALAARAVAEIGLPTAVITRPGMLPPLPANVEEVGLVASDDDSHELLAGLLTTTVALQWTALGLIDAAGTNPDLIRREQALWRAAAAVAGEAW